MKRTIILFGIIGLLHFNFTASAHTFQQPLADDWIGHIDFGQSWQRINFHLQVTGETLTGTVDLPRQNRFGLPLKQVTFDSNVVHIEWQGTLGLAVYKGRLHGDEISGEFQHGELKQPFRMVRTRMFDPKNSARYAGTYRIGKDHFIDVGPFVESEDRPIFFDSMTRRSGVLYALSETEFFSGPSYGNLFPMEVRASFDSNERGEVEGLRWREDNGPTLMGKKVAAYTQEEVNFQNGNVSLQGTLTMPADGRQHPVVVVVPGSGPFRRPGGHWVHFFVRQGIGVFVFDKRGSGNSTGDWRKSSYEDLAMDVLAGVSALKKHESVKPTQIGLWGNSEGGWVAPIAASRSQDVAFLIIRAGSALPVWQTVLHEAEGKLRDGTALSEQEIKEAIEFKRVTEGVAMSGEDWDKTWKELETYYQNSQGKKWFQFMMGPPKDHWFWHWWRLRGPFDPTASLMKIRIPVLVLLGELDWAIPSKASALAFEQAFKRAGNTDYSIKVLPKANHGLLEASTGYGSEFSRLKRYVPGYMDGMATWLRQRVNAKALGRRKQNNRH